jgi:hypothetical protein
MLHMDALVLTSNSNCRTKAFISLRHRQCALYNWKCLEFLISFLIKLTSKHSASNTLHMVSWTLSTEILPHWPSQLLSTLMPTLWWEWNHSVWTKVHLYSLQVHWKIQRLCRAQLYISNWILCIGVSNWECVHKGIPTLNWKHFSATTFVPMEHTRTTPPVPIASPMRCA